MKLVINDELPMLVIPAPNCDHCGEDVQLDGDSAWCENCRVKWRRIYEEAGVPDEDFEGADVVCQIECEEKSFIVDVRGVPTTAYRKPCILPSGHESFHLWPWEVETEGDAA